MVQLVLGTDGAANVLLLSFRSRGRSRFYRIDIPRQNPTRTVVRYDADTARLRHKAPVEIEHMMDVWVSDTSLDIDVPEGCVLIQRELTDGYAMQVRKRKHGEPAELTGLFIPHDA